MKKQAAALLIVMLAALTGLVNAQLRPVIKAEVPFEFEVNGATIPAGECTVTITGDGTPILWVRSGKARAAVIAQDSQSSQASKQTSLVFHKYGDRYFLASINRSGESRGYELPKGKLEAELRAQNVAEHDVTLLASLK